MFKYVKHLNYPVNIKNKDLKMAKYLLTQYGGANGELGAALRYFSQKFTMPDEKGRALLNDIATEEFGHCEMICTMIYQLTKDATIEELEKEGLSSMYTEHGKGIYPANSFGDAFTASYATRVIFIKDGKIFNEINRGNDTRKEFFDKIIDVVTLLGGDLNDAL